MTRSYFRRADGVMLLYDVTNERTFLSVRQWIEAVDVSFLFLFLGASFSGSPIILQFLLQFPLEASIFSWMMLTIIQAQTKYFQCMSQIVK